MDKLPVLSVIIPVYRVEKYIEKCINSLLTQTYIDFEILLIDDGSPDRSGEICDTFAKSDKRVKVYHKQNGGVSSARNLGLERAQGEYITFIDSDDWIDPDCLERIMSICVQQDLDILQYSYKKINDADGSVISIHDYECDPLSWREFVKRDHYLVCVWGNCIRRSIIETHHLRFDERIHLAEDQLFIMSAISFSNRIAQTKRCYYNYVQNPVSATHNPKTEDMIQSSIALFEFGKRNNAFKPQIDRMISTFYVDLLMLQKGDERELNKVYKSENIQMDNLVMKRHKILCIFSLLGLKIASIIVFLYIKIVDIISSK